MSDTSTEFWYSLNGTKQGPISETQLLELIQKKTLTAEDSIWNSNLPDWQEIGNSKFAVYVNGIGQPPPLTGSAVSNTVIWFLAFAPLIGMFLQGFMFGLTGIAVGVWWPITIVLNIVLCVMDEKKVKAAGHNTKTLGSTWLVPVYIFKRTKMLKQNWAVFVIWCITFLMCLCS
jgi:hypothetical protein